MSMEDTQQLYVDLLELLCASYHAYHVVGVQ